MRLIENQIYSKDLASALDQVTGVDELREKRVLLTGATGTIGSFLIDMFLYYNEHRKGNLEIYAASRNIAGMQSRFGPATDKLHFLAYDLLKPIDFSCRPDYVIHAAGNAHPAAFGKDPVGTIIGNVHGTYQLLEFAKNACARRFLYISTGEVYGQGDLAKDSFEETYSGYVDPMLVRSNYPMSKRATETLCAAYQEEFGLETVIVRPSHTYGPGITASDNRASAEFLLKGARGEAIVLRSPGDQLRSYTYIADAASAILTVLLRGTQGQAYNIANPDARCTIAEFAETVSSCAGCQVLHDYVQVKNDTPIRKQVLDTKKLEALGWKGMYPLDRGIRHTLQVLSDTVSQKPESN